MLGRSDVQVIEFEELLPTHRIQRLAQINFEKLYQFFSMSCYLNSISYFFDQLVMDLFSALRTDSTEVLTHRNAHVIHPSSFISFFMNN